MGGLRFCAYRIGVGVGVRIGKENLRINSEYCKTCEISSQQSSDNFSQNLSIDWHDIKD